MKKVTEMNLTIGNAIRDGLQNKRLTQSELAVMVGSTQRSISSYVNGTSQPPLDILKNICRILEINLNQLLNLQDDEASYRGIRVPKDFSYKSLLKDFPKEKQEELKVLIVQFLEVLQK
ncbi:MAG: helix-turn-helix transcriptional regulator [Longicatena sp.]